MYRQPNMPATITYKVDMSQRVFDRLFKEQSLDEMKSMVCRKLGLDLTAPIKLFQLRSDVRGDEWPIMSVDLEDDDDFELFKNRASRMAHIEVKVVILPRDTQVSGDSAMDPSH
ncbi:hypothetical protein BJV78DRAFT_1169164 [Lactifluus subvellereus]|nr:hypothetical protein BJV78DRAFT_1169164 [Lactifluus subvellereus]